ncbi:MAG TPA: hypothetical protein IAA08_08930 [Candidatus Eubacterium avistercoris]|uniref:Uncharacterized protein n=1 Tax=Candidatus Eubacterium avistercoris TaxID=2838567 RepID=A0A9D2D3U4_9FIRM|nr:hypothetical protein [Candidatus Eubacterium avistercoris]
MGKIKKAAAIVAAAVLCMSMSMGVFASSPTDPEQIVNDGKTLTFNHLWMAEGTDKDGNKVTAYSLEDLSQEVKDILSDEDQVKEILTDAGYIVGDDQDITVITAGDLSLMDMENFEKTEVPEGGVDLEINLGSYSTYTYGEYTYENTYGAIQGLKEGSTVYVLHQKDDGTWEVLEGTVKVKTENDKYGSYTGYYVTAHFDSLSPVAVIKVMSNGEVVVLDKNEEYKGTIDINAANSANSANSADKGNTVKGGSSSQLVKTTAEKKSPKTGN